MNLPKWKPDNDEERREFTRWIHDELSRREEMRAGGDPRAERYLAQRLVIVRAALQAGQPVSFVHDKKKRGRPPTEAKDLTPLQRAEIDVPRIRAIFRAYWGKRNRIVPPMAETIAAERWDLSGDDRNKLTARFQRRC